MKKEGESSAQGVRQAARQDMPQDMLQSTNDEELMFAYQNGNEEAFKVLYERYSKKVYGFMMKQFQNAQWAEEAYQMAFLKLHQSRRLYDSSLPFAPWLFTLCRSAKIDILRSKGRVQQKESLDPTAVDLAAVPATQESPTLDGSQDLPDLKKLSTQQREAVQLRYVEDLSFEEIAEKLKTTPINARQVVSRAVRSLKKIMGNRKGDS